MCTITFEIVWFVIVLVFIFEESARKLCVDFQLNVESRQIYISVFLEQEFFFKVTHGWENPKPKGNREKKMTPQAIKKVRKKIVNFKTILKVIKINNLLNCFKLFFICWEYD